MLTSLAPVAASKSLRNTVTFGTVNISFLLTAEHTGGALSLLEAVMRPGSEPPYHIHDREDEVFYITEGHLSVMVDGEIHECRAGQAMFLPRGIPHTFRVRSEIARGLVILNPSGFENYFQSVGKPARSLEVPASHNEVMDFEAAGRAAQSCGVRFMAEQPVF